VNDEKRQQLGDCIQIAHGSGGRATAALLETLFLRYFDHPLLQEQHDAARFPVNQGRMVVSTDAHVITPLFFPGGDIGSLSVHGTINDVAMSGAMPLYLSAAFVLEEGLPLAILERVVASMAAASREAGVPIITGDTKVVERGKGDGMYITTTGIGVVADGVDISGHRARPGDAIILSGNIGEHGMAVLSHRENLGFETTLQSDTAALHGLVQSMLAVAPNIHCLRDPTRGGVATALNEIASQSKVAMELDEQAIPIPSGVMAACELLGLDPLYIANEGKLLCVCTADDAPALLAAMQAHPLGRQAAIIGKVRASEQAWVQMNTSLGGLRMVDWLSGELLPRIC